MIRLPEARSSFTRWFGFCASALLAAGALLTPAQAQAAEPYMWGAGGHIATFVVPGKYPMAFPTKVENYNFIEEGPQAGDESLKGAEKKRDLDANGKPLYHTLERVKTDIRVGGDFVYYLSGENRIGAALDLGFGKQYLDGNVMARYDRVLNSFNEFDILGGLGLGVGSMTFRGSNENEKLRVSYFPARGHVGAAYRTDTMSIQASLFLRLAIPSNQVYVTADGTEHEGVGSPVSFASHPAIGVELTALFGDFKPPVKKKGKGGKKGGGAKKGGGKKGGGKKR